MAAAWVAVSAAVAAGVRAACSQSAQAHAEVEENNDVPTRCGTADNVTTWTRTKEFLTLAKVLGCNCPCDHVPFVEAG